MADRGPGEGEWLSGEDGRLCQSRDLNLARFQRTRTDERPAIINATRNMESDSPLCNGNMTTSGVDPGLCSGKGGPEANRGYLPVLGTHSAKPATSMATLPSPR